MHHNSPTKENYLKSANIFKFLKLLKAVIVVYMNEEEGPTTNVILNKLNTPRSQNKIDFQLRGTAKTFP